MELTLRATFVEYLPPVNGGAVIAVILTLEAEYSYECLYWVHPNGNTQLIIDEKFLKLFDALKTEDLHKSIYDAVMQEVIATIPTKEEIFANYAYTE